MNCFGLYASPRICFIYELCPMSLADTDSAVCNSQCSRLDPRLLRWYLVGIDGRLGIFVVVQPLFEVVPNLDGLFGIFTTPKSTQQSYGFCRCSEDCAVIVNVFVYCALLLDAIFAACYNLDIRVVGLERQIKLG